jgi:hypothetical protein
LLETKEFIDSLSIGGSQKLLLRAYLEKYDYALSSLLTLSHSLLEKALLDAQLPPLVCGHVLTAIEHVRQIHTEQISGADEWESLLLLFCFCCCFMVE